MDHVSGLKTNDVIGAFMQNHLMKRGFAWIPDHRRMSKAYKEKLNELCVKLYKISEDLERFIIETQKETFENLLDIDIFDDLAFNQYSLEALGHSIFDDHGALTIYSLVTFLFYGAELATKVMQRASELELIDEGLEKVSEVVSWLCKYIDEDQLDWLEEYYQGWFGIVETYEPSEVGKKRTVDTRRSQATETTQKVKYHHVGMAAIAVLVGGLYLCSKFPVQ